MNKEKVFAWIESLEDMADQSDRYFVERTELYKENQEKDKEIERLNNEIKTLLKENGNKEKVIIKQNNIINRMEKDMRETIEILKTTEYQKIDIDYVIETLDIYCDRLKRELKEGK